MHTSLSVGEYVLSSNSVYQDKCFFFIDVAPLTVALWKRGVIGLGNLEHL